MCLADTAAATLRILSENTKIPISLLCPVLHSMVFGPYKLLIKTPMTDQKIRDNEDVFRLNANFRSRKRMLQLPVIIVDPPRVKEKIQEDRKFYFEAIVVRIMKARKRMAHKELIKEVMSQSTITADSKFIKTILEKLIEKEYLERASEDNSVYFYVA
jgi:cullin 1